ncbi:MAG: hypothetical protein LBD04_01965 [Synergistaceae bacterium]|jgi:aspartyl-tRNA synthetase|nr:hypothetical protein [Synergistaceae bacterium]
MSRKALSEVEERAKKLGASGLGVFQVKEGELKGPVVSQCDKLFSVCFALY